MKEKDNLSSSPAKSSELSFEDAFARLEVILEKMNSSSVSLDESLKLFEEADKLILSCNKRLTEAERRIEILVKNRSGELTQGPDGRPLTQDFNLSPPSQSSK